MANRYSDYIDLTVGSVADDIADRVLDVGAVWDTAPAPTGSSSSVPRPRTPRTSTSSSTPRPRRPVGWTRPRAPGYGAVPRPAGPAAMDDSDFSYMQEMKAELEALPGVLSEMNALKQQIDHANQKQKLRDEIAGFLKTEMGKLKAGRLSQGARLGQVSFDPASPPSYGEIQELTSWQTGIPFFGVIPANGTINITTEPQQHFRGQLLHVGDTLALSVSIQDVKVSNASQLIAGGGISGEFFPTDGQFPGGKNLQTIWCKRNSKFELTVSNNTGLPVNFSGVYWGEATLLDPQ